MVKHNEEAVPQANRETYEAIVAMSDTVCKKHLNDEYAEMARNMAATLARKRPSPLVNGKPQSWACGIVYALGTINFLYDRSQTPHMRAEELCKLFGVSSATGSAKGKAIREMLKITLLDWKWYLPSRLESHPSAFYIMVNGFIVDARSMPREVQAIAFQKGLIPYIPDDRR